MTPESMMKVAEDLSELENHFVHHERFAPLEQRFRFLIQKRLADIGSGRSREARGLTLTGESGAGKTTAIKHLLTKTESWIATTDTPDAKIISLDVPSTPGLKALGHKVLAKLGYPQGRGGEGWYLWGLIRHHVREQKVVFIHLDEAQHLAGRRGQKELIDMISELKTMMSDSDWPVGILMSGTVELEALLNQDPQISRRMDAVHFGPIAALSQTENILGLISVYCSKARLPPEADIDTVEFVERLVHAAARQFGLMIEIICQAIEQARLAEAENLEMMHFATAYRNRTDCSDTFNPFIIPDFYRVDPRQIFARDRS
ncbi:ATP-binding protein [Ferrimonas balearica]|nr:ATP-binding protein [Ferrimonas balearica]